MTSTKSASALLLAILTLALCTSLPGCKKSNSSPPAMTATIGTTTTQFTGVAYFNAVVDSIFAFNMQSRQSTDSSYLFQRDCQREI
jgi:hypothetical protein